jgi:hypothetical protein
MNSELEALRWLAFLALWRMTYDLAQAPREPEVHYLIQREPPEESLDARRQSWAGKAARNFALAQTKSWQRWNAAMFEKAP